VNLQGGAEEDWRAAVRLVRISGLAPVACGPGVAAAMEEHGLSPLATVPNAVGPAPPPADRTELGFPAATRVVLAVGRLVDQKNHALAIRAIGEVPAAGLAIAGDGELRPELERLAAETGVADRVHFLGLRTDARALMGAADVIVLPSHWEGLPLAALEALASGTPLVATDVRGLRELLTDGENALLVPEDAAALATALRRVLDDPGLAARLATGGKQVEGAGSDARLVERFLELYERLAA
jgi:glycosyltransferase involved in cell wall biosynthesis